MDPKFPLVQKLCFWNIANIDILLVLKPWFWLISLTSDQIAFQRGFKMKWASVSIHWKECPRESW